MIIHMHAYIGPLLEQYHKHADAGKAASQKAYLLNQFAHFGIITPERRRLNKAYFKSDLPEYEDLFSVIRDMYAIPEREMHQAAIELAICYKKQWDSDFLKIIGFLITHNSWWDSVDHIAVELAGEYLRIFPGKMKAISTKWNRSNNMWLQRTSIIFQLHYKKNTDTSLLFSNILHVASSKEFFIQKAIGWSLRQYAKTDPATVRAFVENNKLPALSVREAMKSI